MIKEPPAGVPSEGTLKALMEGEALGEAPRGEQRSLLLTPWKALTLWPGVNHQAPHYDFPPPPVSLFVLVSLLVLF